MNFPSSSESKGVWDGESFQKEIVEGVTLGLHIDKRAKAFSKAFTISLGVGLTSPRFAPTADRPFELAVNLFQFFGIGPLPMQWTYHTEADLREALAACSRLVKQVLAIFEPEAAKMQHAYRRSLTEFTGPRQLTAREAYEVALRLATDWATDAILTRVVCSNVAGPYLSGFHFVDFRQMLPTLTEEGQSAMNGGWYLSFYSRKKEEALNISLPCYGPIRRSRLYAPHGRQWPSDTDKILRAGWLDSREALALARAKLQSVMAPDPPPEIQLFELDSRANVLATGVLQAPLRDGMFKMEPAWRISFSRTDERGRTIATVTIPAYADAEAAIEVRAFDDHGRPQKGPVSGTS